MGTAEAAPAGSSDAGRDSEAFGGQVEPPVSVKGEEDPAAVAARKGKSCKGYLYYSSQLKTQSRKPVCVGVTRTLHQGPPPPLPVSFYSLVGPSSFDHLPVLSVNSRRVFFSSGFLFSSEFLLLGMRKSKIDFDFRE